MFHPNTLRFIQWWRDLPRQGGRAPGRAAVEPAELSPLLPQVFMLGADLRFRLAGGLLCDLHGGELRGRAFAPMWSMLDRAPLSLALERCVERTEPTIIQGEAYPENGDGVGLQVTLAPLSSTPDGVPDRLIGLYQPTSLLARLQGQPVRSLALRRVHPERPANDARLRLIAVEGRRIA